MSMKQILFGLIVIGSLCVGRSWAQQPTASNGLRNSGVLLVQNFSDHNPKIGGTYKDSKGSSVQYMIHRVKSTNYLLVKYNLKNGGYCGFWYRAGSDWDGQNWTKAKAISFDIRTLKPLIIQINFDDVNNQNYVANTSTIPPSHKWQVVSIPMSAFGLNPYYQPANAEKGKPEDLSLIKTFTVAPQTPGHHWFEITNIVLKK